MFRGAVARTLLGDDDEVIEDAILRNALDLGRPRRAVLLPLEQLLLSAESTRVATGLNDVEGSVAYCGLDPATGDDPGGEYMGVHSDPNAGETGSERDSLPKEGASKTCE